ncbi:hypothetical protein HAX54_051229 [Datura stramonium]|uniref:Uncharacterized protein n=1 Tax=Datura stramonium TaxID=4076 RepID=A0ABS8WM82_DATST|nr:hypothetical protein [Datura stramonium]
MGKRYWSISGWKNIPLMPVQKLQAPAKCKLSVRCFPVLHCLAACPDAIIYEKSRSKGDTTSSRFYMFEKSFKASIVFALPWNLTSMVHVLPFWRGRSMTNSLEEAITISMTD